MTKLSSRRQVAPKSVLEGQKRKPGTESAGEEIAGGALLRPRKPFKTTKLDEVRGCLKSAGPAKTLNDMERGIKAAVKARHNRGRY